MYLHSTSTLNSPSFFAGSMATGEGAGTTTLEMFKLILVATFLQSVAAGSCRSGTYKTTVCKRKCLFVCWDSCEDKCHWCPPGRFQPENYYNGGSCTKCPQGQYSVPDSIIANWCKGCNAGRYQPYTEKTQSSDCLPCQSGKRSNYAAASCNFCPQGFSFTSTSEDCTRCAAGQYQPSNNLASVSCDDCLTGFFSTNDEAATCDSCLPGQYQANIGQEFCDECELGTKFISTKVPCENCAAGKYSTSATVATCEPCETGKYSAFAEATCSDCAAGKYGDANVFPSSEAHCKVCAPGYYTDQPAVPTQCKSCQAGFFMPSSISDRTDCIECSTAVNEEETTCAGCDPGQFAAQQADPCTPCLIGTFAGGGATSCTECRAGYYGVADQKYRCIGCRFGTYSNVKAATNLDVCQNCAAGKYGNAFAATSEGACVPCGRGTYNLDHGLGGSASCKLCAAGRTSMKTERTDSCDPCEVGKYLEDEGSSARCKNCPQGYYQRYVFVVLVFGLCFGIIEMFLLFCFCVSFL